MTAPTRQVVVLAGGLGTRMLPRTERLPKVLLPVNGRPFAALLLERLARCGFHEVVFSIAHLGEQVRAFVGDGAQFGLRVAYVDEGPTLRGTGGALRLADDLGVLADSFLVTYGDSYLPFDYAAPLDMLRADASLSSVMAVFHNQRQWDASNVKLTADGRRVASYEKGTSDPSYEHIDYGATALRRSCLARVPTDGAYGLDRLQHALAAEGTMGACVAAERFFEVGSPEGLATLEAYLAEGARSVTGAMKAPSR